MDVDAKSTDVAERLRRIQSKKGLTIQDMADKCGLPKRSLENYMNLKDPQRPGVDALVAIADGLDLSLDWIVGRTADDPSARFSKQDYAFFCNSVVIALLSRILEVAIEDPSKAIEPKAGKVLGYEVHEVAALAMLDFISCVELQASGDADAQTGYFKRHFENLSRMVREATGTSSVSGLANRKP